MGSNNSRLLVVSTGMGLFVAFYFFKKRSLKIGLTSGNA